MRTRAMRSTGASSTISSRVDAMAADAQACCALPPVTTEAQGLWRRLHLASPALPIGAYSYSQGLERVVEDGIVRDAASAQAWIGDLLGLAITRGEAAFAWRLLAAASQAEWQAFAA